MTEQIKKITSKTLFGFTIKEISYFISILFIFFMFYLNIQTRILGIENRNIQFDKEIVDIKAEIERNKVERIKQIDDLRNENREEHKILLTGQQEILKILIQIKK